MKNRKLIDSWNKINPGDSTDSRMLSAILAENRRVRRENSVPAIRKSSSGESRRMKQSRKVFCGIVVAALVLIGAVSAGAISLNKPFFPTKLPVLSDQEARSAVREVASTDDAAKSELFHKMLNSIDYFDTVQVSLEALQPHITEAIAVTAEVDFLTGESYESITPVSSEPPVNGILPWLELYADAEQVTTYDNVEKTYSRRPAFARQSEEEELGRNALRVYVDQRDSDSGTPTYVYRQDATNTVMGGSYCLFPQGLAFGFLTDFSLWEITGTSEYLGRSCIELAGMTTASYASKVDAETFTMCVDGQTGILLKYEAKDENGVTTSYVTVKEISVDVPLTESIHRPSQEKYAEYGEE